MSEPPMETVVKIVEEDAEKPGSSQQTARNRDDVPVGRMAFIEKEGRDEDGDGSDQREEPLTHKERVLALKEARRKADEQNMLDELKKTRVAYFADRKRKE
eukprot:gene17917-21334_t